MHTAGSSGGERGEQMAAGIQQAAQEMNEENRWQQAYSRQLRRWTRRTDGSRHTAGSSGDERGEQMAAGIQQAAQEMNEENRWDERGEQMAAGIQQAAQEV